LAGVTSSGVFRVLKFGKSTSCDLVAENITSQWPNRLSLEVRTNGESASVRTKLVGAHWTPAILASLLAAQECGIPLKDAADVVSSLTAFAARMQPVELPSGAVVIRDEYNGSPYSYEAALAAFEQAEAERKILIAGDYSDSTVKRRRRLARLGKTAAGLCDLAIFIGEHSHHSRDGAIHAGLDPEKVLNFAFVFDAVSALKKILRRGDLVLLKSRSTDHFSRLLFAQVGEVSCWKPTCPERFLCDICWQLGCDEADMKKLKPL
jgi:UDP-N-acetylmuramoyl-tripeptide--D-alanyl-D-alanine ligase